MDYKSLIPLKNIVLDIDETLLHSEPEQSGGIVVYYRPGVFDFLRSLQKVFNLYIYTAGTKYYAESIINDIKKFIPDMKFLNVMSREHLLTEKSNNTTKCLYHFYNQIFNDIDNLVEIKKRIIKEKIRNTIIIDNVSYNFHRQPNNGINIHDFY